MADQNFRVKHGIGIGTNTFVDANRNINAGIATIRHARVTGIATVGIISAIDGNGAQGIVTFQSRIGISSNGNTITIAPPSAGAGITQSYEIILPPRVGTDGQTLTIGPNGQLGFTTAGLYENRFYVSAANGDDANDGRALPVKTIKRAAQLASFRSFNLPGGRYIDAGNLLEVNKNFIKEEVVGFVTFTYPSILTNLDYDAAICKRDVGYIVDAIVYDLSYGGNSKSVEAGLAYWNAGTSYVDGESVETIAGYRYIIDLSKKIINNVAVTTSYQSPSFAISQTFDNSIAYDESCNPIAYSENCCADVLSAIGSYVGIVTSIIGIGTTAAPNVTLPSTQSQPIAIIVEAGDYVEDNPVILYEDVAVLGDNLRNTVIRPSNAGKDLFRVRNGVYVSNFAMKDYVDPAGIPQYTFDYAVAFDDPTDVNTSRVGYATKTTKPVITRSPYIQNCSILSFLGGNGILVDGNKVETPNTPLIPEEVETPVAGAQPEQGRSMVAAAFTMVSFGGIGWRCINEGYAQVVSCFQIFCKYGSLCQSGGYLSITNSATNFGYYALRSVGWSPNSFKFDRGRVAATGISGGLQTLKVIGVGRTDQDLYVLRFYNNANVDQTSSFKPVTTQAQFNATTGISTISDTFLITTHPFSNQDTVLYIGDEGANPPKVIGGLVSGNQYYVSYIDENTIQLYEDDSLTRLVNLTAGVVGIHTLQKGNLEFFVNEMLNNHGVYQSVGLASTSSTLNFVSGRQVLQQVPGGNAVGYALTYKASTRQLIVSVEESGGVRRLFGVTDNVGSLKIADHSGSPISVAVTSVTGITTYRTVEFKVDSTPSGTTITGIANLPENYQLFFHRPSIINSSSHTWEYSGSGIDYNALPQNGGQTRVESEQIFELGGRVYSSGTNELGDFKIGSFITAFNRTGNIIFNNKVTIGVLASLKLSLSGGVEIEAFSTDVGLGDNEIGGATDTKVPTQKAVRTFLNNRLGNFIDKNLTTNAVPSAVVQLNATGQINADLIPPKVVNYYRANVSGGRTDLVNLIPTTNLQNGDTVIEPGNGYVLISDVYGQYLILSDDTRNYNFDNEDVVISANSAGGAVGIVTGPPVNAVGYGTTGLVKGVLLGVSITNGGSGYTNPGVYTCVLDRSGVGIGTSARAAITVGASGTVTSVRVNFGGRYYTSGDVLTINDDNLIGGRSGGAKFTATVNDIETRLYLALTNNQKFTGNVLLPDYIQDGDAVAISTDTSVGYGKTFDPTDTSTGGSVDFTNDRIIIGTSEFSDGDPIIYSANGGNVIGGLTPTNTYYIKRVGITSVELYNSYALASKVDFTSSGTGTATLTRVGVNTADEHLIFANHGYTTGDAVKTSGTTPTGITTDAYYFVGSLTDNSLTLHATRNDALTSVNGLILNPVGIADTNGGTFSLTKQNVTYSATVNTSSAIFDNWTVLSSASIDGANITSGTISPARLGTGNATDTTFLAGDSSYKKVITSVGIGTTQPISATGTTFDSAPGGIGINTYYGKVELRLNRAAGTGDLYSTLGVAKFKTSTFSVDADGAVSIKPSATGDIDAATLGGVSGAYFLDPTNFTGNIPISRGGTGLTALPSLGAILQGNGLSYDLVTAPTFYGDVTITNNGRLSVAGIAATNLSVTGVTGIATFQNFRVTNEVISGVSTFSGSGNNINQTAGTAALNRLTVAGVSTFSNTVNADTITMSSATAARLTNAGTIVATNQTISGIVTLTSSSNNIQQQAGTAELNNLTVAGVSTFVSLTNFGTTNVGTLNVTGTMDYANSQTSGVSTFSGSGNNINQTNGTATLNRLTVAGVSTLGVTTTTSLYATNLSVSGVTTFIGQVNAGILTATEIRGPLTNTLTIRGPLTGNSYNNTSAVTIGIAATDLNTAGQVVQRNSAGGFNAGIITATFSGNASGTTATYTTGNITTVNSTNTYSTVGLITYLSGENSNYSGIATASRFVSSVAQGTAPVSVASSTIVANFNATYLEGYSTNTANITNTIVRRDGDGDFAARNITATSFIGSLNNTLGVGTYLTGSYNNSAAATIAINATPNNTANFVVARDSAGGFNAGIITSTNLILNAAGSTTSAQLVFNGATNNWINFGTVGFAAPTFTTRSVGTKIVLYNQIGAAAADYALGIESGTLWFGLPTTAQRFKWYGGTTLAAELDGSGNFRSIGITTATRLVSIVAQGTAPISVASSTVVSNLNVSYLEGYATETANSSGTIVRRDNSGDFTSNVVTVNQLIATNNGNGTNVRIGDDAWIGDINVANTIRISGVSDATKGYITFGNSSNTALGRDGTGALTWGGNTIWHSGNDGTGSGLDADLLDGQNLVDNAATVSTVVGRDGSGDIVTRYYRSATTNANQSFAGQHNVDAPFYNTFSQTGSQYQAIVKGRCTGATTTDILSFGNLHNNDNTQSFAFHRIRSDGTNSVAYTLSGAGGTIWHSGNDGSGSGLDADLLDGINSGQFIRSDANQTATGSYLFQRNNPAIINTSYAQGNNHIELRTTDASNPIIGFHRSGFTATALYHSGYGVNSLRIRNADGADGPIWWSGNDGAGSGLNADLLDGVQGASFLRSDVSATNSVDLRAPIFYQSDDTNCFWNNNDFVLRGGAPTITFRDTDHNTGYIHCNSNLLYVLRGANDAAPGAWAQVGGQWPFIFNLSNNDATCGRDLYAVSSMRAPIFYDSNDTGFYVDPRNTSLTVDMRADIFYDRNDAANYYVDANNISYFNDIRPFIMYDRNNTGFYCDPASTSQFNVILSNNYIQVSSDARLKTNIETIPNALEKVLKLRGVEYDRVDLDPNDPATNIHQYGFIAQEVEEIVPELVGNVLDYKTVNYDSTTPILVEAIKEQQKMIEEMRKEINELKTMIVNK